MNFLISLFSLICLSLCPIIYSGMKNPSDKPMLCLHKTGNGGKNPKHFPFGSLLQPAVKNTIHSHFFIESIHKSDNTA